MSGFSAAAAPSAVKDPFQPKGDIAMVKLLLAAMSSISRSRLIFALRSEASKCSSESCATAVTWLLDVVSPDYRLHGVLRRYPVALAAMARYHTKACVEGAREGYRTARTELAGVLPPHAIDTVLTAYRKEGARLAATARAVGLVERALRGEVFSPKMQDKRATR